MRTSDQLQKFVIKDKNLSELIETKNASTLELNSGLQVSGVLDSFMSNAELGIFFFKFSGPSQLAFNNHQLAGHGPNYHAHGYSTPIGPLTNGVRLSQLPKEHFSRQNIHYHIKNELDFESGVRVVGVLNETVFSPDHKPMIFSFTECEVSFKDEILFRPEWGSFDMAIGELIVSAFSGPADKSAFYI